MLQQFITLWYQLKVTNKLQCGIHHKTVFLILSKACTWTSIICFWGGWYNWSASGLARPRWTLQWRAWSAGLELPQQLSYRRWHECLGPWDGWQVLGSWTHNRCEKVHLQKCNRDRKELDVTTQDYETHFVIDPIDYYSEQYPLYSYNKWSVSSHDLKCTKIFYCCNLNIFLMSRLVFTLGCTINMKWEKLTFSIHNY